MAVFYFHILLCIAVTAVIWFMQVVQYPLIPFVDAAQWKSFCEKKRMQTIMISYPLMAFEALSGITLLLIAVQSPAYVPLIVSMLLLGVLHVFSFMYLQPLFKKIQSPVDLVSIQKFKKTHWIRTIGWSIRLLILLGIILASA